MEKMTKKEMYEKGLPNVRTYINGETMIKPYFYLRGNHLHVRYTVDRAIELSEAETSKVKADITLAPADKQGVLSKAFNFFTTMVGKTVIMDGIALADKIMADKRMTDKRMADKRAFEEK